jgi:peptidoglycan/LPS O-acetylase OafA/YrhL
MGVNLFFILSGFVLYRPYYLGTRSFVNGKDIWLFYKHRFLRLYPLLTFNLLVCLLLMGPVNKERLSSFAMSLFALSCFSQQHLLPALNPVLWSLAVELWFSVLFPFLVLAINRVGFRLVFVAILLIALLTRIAGMFYLHPNTNISLLRDSLGGRIDDFLIGMLLVSAYERYNGFADLSNTHICLAAFVSMIMLFTGFIGWDFTILGVYTWYSLPLLNNCVQLGFMGLVVLAVKRNGVFHKLFRLWFLQVSGMMCFSLYIWHYLFVSAIDLSLPFVYNYLFYLLFTYCLSAFTYRYIEFGGVKNYKKLFLLG